MGILGEHLSNSADLTWQKTNLGVRLPPPQRRGGAAGGLYCPQAQGPLGSYHLCSKGTLHATESLTVLPGLVWRSLPAEAYEKESLAGRLPAQHALAVPDSHTLCVHRKGRCCLTCLLECAWTVCLDLLPG